jgi:TolB-like protein
MKITLLSFILMLFCVSIIAADIQDSVVALLSSLSKQYEEGKGNVYLKRPLAVLPFVEVSELARKYHLGTVTEELLRKEIVNSNYFILTERKNMERILEEIEFSLSDLVSSDTAVRVGNLTGAAYFIAGSITEAGDNFLLNSRLIDIETAIVIGAESVTIEKSELIKEARSTQYSYVFRYGLGLYATTGMEVVLNEIFSHMESSPGFLNLSTGVFYRPWNFLQLSFSIGTEWGEFQFGQFDHTSPDYDNSGIVEYYQENVASGTHYINYNIEYAQSYLDLQVLFVFNPIKQLTISAGGGGLLGLWNARIELGSFPVYVGGYDSDGYPVDLDLEENYIIEDIIINSGNGGIFGGIGTLKIEYYISPRVFLFASFQYKKAVFTEPVDYLFGAISVAPDDEDGFLEASKWQPAKTPYGDSLSFEMDSIVFNLGVAISF